MPAQAVVSALLFVCSSLLLFVVARVWSSRMGGDLARQRRLFAVVHGTLVVLIAITNYVVGYQRPALPIWDEKYHVPCAERYLHGVSFQEEHPPLGKLLIALGERLVEPNRDVAPEAFLETVMVRTFPPGFSFAGVRLPGVIAATLSALILYLILLELIPSSHFAYLLSGLYLFDNALVVHSRIAVLEPFQLLFCLTALWLFIRLYRSGRAVSSASYLALGALIGLAVSVKVTAAVLALLFVPLVWRELAADAGSLLARVRTRLPELLVKGILFAGGIVTVFLAVYFVHFQIGERVIAGRQSRAFPAAAEPLDVGRDGSFATRLWSDLGFTGRFEQGVGRFDPSDPNDDGSLPYGWPVGSRSIVYRSVPDGDGFRYLCLQCNPVVWFAVLAAIVAAVVIVGGRWLEGGPGGSGTAAPLIGAMLALWVAYMATMLGIDRVLYLYHYLLPLLFGFVLLAACFADLFRELALRNDARLYLATFLLGAEIAAVFLFFSPLTYFEPLRFDDLMVREWSQLWGLTRVP